MTSGSTSNRVPGPPGQPCRSASSVRPVFIGSPSTVPSCCRYPAYRMSCSLWKRGPGASGPSGANTVMVGRIRPPPPASVRCLTDSAAMSAASRVPRRSRTRRLRQYSLPMQRLLLRQATRAPKASSAWVWV